MIDKLIPPGYRLLAVVLLAAAAFVAGWSANGWRLGTKISDLKSDWSEERAELAEEKTAALSKLTDEKEALQLRLSAIETEKHKGISDAKAETARLQASIDRGDYRVLIRAKCPPTMPAEAGNSGVDSRAGTELDPEARSDYLDVKESAERFDIKLSACQASLQELTAQP